MTITVHPSRLEGTIIAPPSKSIMQRACIAAFLADGESVIGNPALSEDCLSLLDALENLGASIRSSDAGIHISGSKSIKTASISAGESGLGTRLLIPLLALYEQALQIDAVGSMKTRPLKPLLDTLPTHGVNIETSDNGLLPWTIQGPLKPGHFSIDGSVSSQFLSGLLMVLPTLDGDSVIEVSGLESRPYIDMTLEIMEYFGVAALNSNYEKFSIPGNQQYNASSIFVDGDWSSAASLFVATAVAAKEAVRIDEVGGEFTQADQAINGALLFAGCRIHREDNNYLVYPGKLRAFQFNASDSPDLVPVLAALAVFCKGKSSITGISRLVHKESSRAIAIQKEFAKAGILVELEADTMTIHPGRVQTAVLDSHNDHRMAMAEAILGLGGAPITIKNANSVGKSYPTFFEDLSALGAQITRSKK